MEPFAETAWQAWSPDDLYVRLHGLGLDWYVAGGWALDLWHGRQTRAHEDLECVVLANQLETARKALSELEFFTASAGRLTHLPKAAPVPDDVWQAWGAEVRARCWRVDMMVERGTKEHWVYKRDPTFTLPRAAAVRQNERGMPYLAPAIVLLFKARHARDKDQQDFLAALPRLEREERADLGRWLSALHPGHPWLAMLQSPRMPGAT
jgi:hypothetical protein